LIEQVKGANPDIDEKDLTFDFELDEADIATASSRVTDGDNSHWSGPQAGATSVVVCIRGDQVYCANAGDSRAVFSRKDGQVVDMSEDHKPMNTDERQRIIKAGGFVSEGRVNGSLALSRALGDFDYKGNKELCEKEQAVTAFPEIREFQLQGGDEFMILACDGIWDVLTSEQCVAFVRERLREGLQKGESETFKLSQICEELCDKCLAPDTRGTGLGCDNMSVVIVLLKKFCSFAA
jgi:serine/threonine protein phosphatase PrpC